MVAEGDILWEPTAEHKSSAAITHYMGWLRQNRKLEFDHYASLWQWSVDHVEDFWQSLVDYFNVEFVSPPQAVLQDRGMPDVTWFPGATLNYAQRALTRRDDHLAVIYASENGEAQRLTYNELYHLVARARSGLVALGVDKGDRVAAFASNRPETLALFLAAASLGATWSSCAPEFGVSTVLDRFAQIEPKVLFASLSYPYSGKRFSRREHIEQIAAGLSGLSAVITLGEEGDELPQVAGHTSWADFLGEPHEIEFVPVPFEHPLWILYSSGTTGLPKAIVQGHGGILLEHLKALTLHCDLSERDRFFWFTTTGWMMWNFLISGLLIDATIVLYDGSPGYPNLNALWEMAAELEITYFGTSAPYLLACRKEELVPKKFANLSKLRGVGSTGAPLPVEGFAWVYENVSSDVLLGSVSGGTDVCTAFVLSCPLLPVTAGEIQCRGLGCRVEAFGDDGQPVVNEVGELVMTKPMPSMPVFFWNDKDGQRLHESYFATYKNVWRHGDWIRMTDRGTCAIYGRSDSTLNRGGVRMGTSEFYRIVDDIDQVKDSLVVDTGTLEHEGKLWLFVVLQPHIQMNDDVVAAIRSSLREKVSPRHVPDEIRPIAVVPRTLNGKKLEVPIKKILLGAEPQRALNVDTLQDPQAIEPFVQLAAELRSA